MRDESQTGDRDEADVSDSDADTGARDGPESSDASLERPSEAPAPSPDAPAPLVPAFEPEPAAAIEPLEPDEPFGGRLNRTIAGRPLIVYLVLIAGGATLLLLLAIVWISATQNGGDRPQFCSPITALEAQQAILDGQVERMIVLVDEESPLTGLTGMRLELLDETCREPLQGADVRDDLYQIIGAAEFFNTFGEQRVRISYQRQDIPAELLSTSTPTPTATLPPTETPTPTETPLVTPTDTPTETPSATETATPVPATPVPADTETPTATATATVTETATPATELPELDGSPVLASPEASPARAVTPRPEATSTP